MLMAIRMMNTNIERWILMGVINQVAVSEALCTRNSSIIQE